MLKSRDFWVGIALGVIGYYVYTNHIKKGPGGMLCLVPLELFWSASFIWLFSLSSCDLIRRDQRW